MTRGGADVKNARRRTDGFPPHTAMSMFTLGFAPSSCGNSCRVNAATCSCTATSKSAFRSARLSVRTCLLYTSDAADE